jgi:hypothetical protein
MGNLYEKVTAGLLLLPFSQSDCFITPPAGIDFSKITAILVYQL